MARTKLDIAICANNYQRAVVASPDQMLQEEKRVVVGPVHVVKNQHNWLVRRCFAQERSNIVEKAESSLLRLNLRFQSRHLRGLAKFLHQFCEIRETLL